MFEEYVGFYTSHLFWVDGRPNFQELNDEIAFNEAMEEVVFSHSTQDYTLKMCKDGLFMVRIEAIEEELINIRKAELRYEKTGKGTYPSDDQALAHRKYYHYLNALLFLFDGVVLRDMRHFLGNVDLRMRDASRIFLEGDNFKGGGPVEGIMGRFIRTYNPYFPMDFNPYIRDRLTTIPSLAFDKLVVEFEKIYKDYDKVKILSQIMVAIGSYRFIDFTASLVQSWFVIEYFLNWYWIDFLAGKRDGFAPYNNEEGSKVKWRNSMQRDTLVGRDFTSSVMSNMLELSGIIDHRILSKLIKFAVSEMMLCIIYQWFTVLLTNSRRSHKIRKLMKLAKMTAK